jgi:hypothetical protein
VYDTYKYVHTIDKPNEKMKNIFVMPHVAFLVHDVLFLCRRWHVQMNFKRRNWENVRHTRPSS